MNYDKRLNRLATILPDQAARLGCRREDHELRERVENIPEDEPKREEILARRRAMVRETLQVGSRVRVITEGFQTFGQVGTVLELRDERHWRVELDGTTWTTELGARDLEVIG